MEANFTKGELLIGILMRLANRYTTEEIEYFEKFHQKPIVLFNKDGEKGKYYTTTQIQRLTQAWRAEVNPEYRILSDDEFDKIEQLADEILNEKNIPVRKKKVESVDMKEPNEHIEKEAYFIDLKEKAELPVIKGLLGNKFGKQTPIAVIPDSGSQVNLISYRSLMTLGFDEQDIKPEEKLSINTAADSGNQAMGLIRLTLFMKADDTKYYHKDIICVVLDGPLNKLLLGGPGLEDFTVVNDGPYRKFGITCFNAANKECHPLFITNTFERRGELSTFEKVKVTRQPTTFPLMSESPLCPEKLLTTKGLRGINVHHVSLAEDSLNARYSTKDDLPRDLQYVYNVTLSSKTNKRFHAGSKVALWTADELYPEERESIMAMLTEQSARGEDEEMLPYVGRVEDATIEKVAVCIDHEFAPDPKEPCLPDLDHLSPAVAERFGELFKKHPQAMSEHKFDIARCDVPPATIHTLPGKVAADPVKRHNPEEMLIIEQYIQDMLNSGQIAELEPHEASEFNHRLLLVHRQDPESKKFVSSKADKLSQKERIEELKKSCRLVSDLQSLNQITVSEGTMELRKFSELVPLFNKQKVSTADVRSGFSNVELDYASSMKTTFTFRDKKYRYLRLPQGARNSPFQFAHRLGLVLNKKDFEDFLAEKYPDQQGKLEFDKLIIVYLDDLSLLGCDDDQHYIAWHYVLDRFAKRGLKLHAKKVHVLKENVTFLGFNVNPEQSKYGMTAERKSAFQGWKFRADKAYLCSRLCTASYFDSVCFGFKVLTQGLHILIRQKDMHVKHLHKREFEMFRLMMDIQLDCTIPDLSKPLLISTDASVSCTASCLMQYRAGSSPADSVLELCAVSTKQFKNQDSGKSILYKEILSFLSALETYEYYIRCSSSVVIVFTDASCLSYLHRLKDSNSRLKTTSLYLSSFDRIYVYHCRGAWLNFLADSLSRITAGMKMESTAAIPRKFLEKIPQIELDECMINPRTFFEICNQPLPCKMFSDIPARYTQAYAPVKTEADLVKMTEGDTVEKSILDAIVFGYPSLSKDTKVFLNEKGNKVMSKTEFSAVAKKYKFAEIKQHLVGLVCRTTQHVNHTEVTQEVVDQVREFVMQVLTFMRINPEHFNDHVHSLGSRYLNLSTHSSSVFHEFLNRLQETSLYNEDSGLSDDYESTLFVPVTVARTAGAYLEAELTPGEDGVTGALLIKARNRIVLNPKHSKAIFLGLNVKTKYSVTVQGGNNQDVLTHPDWDATELGLNNHLTQLLIYNQSNRTTSFKSGETVAKILVHMNPRGVCSCEKFSDIRFVSAIRDSDKDHHEVDISEVSILFAGMITSQISATSTTLYTDGNNVMATSLDEILDHPIEEENNEAGDANQSLQGEDDESPYMAQVPGPHGQPVLAPVKSKALNKLLISGIIYKKREVMTDKLVRQLQMSSAHLREKKQQVIDGITDNFMIEDDILYFIDDGKMKMCLNDETLEFLVASIHQRGQHVSPDILKAHFEEILYNQNMKKIIAEGETKCAVCIFNRPCYRRKYVNVPSQRENFARWDRVHIDQVENLPYSRNGYKYLTLFTDYATNFTICEPLRTLQASEITAATARIFRYFGPCKEVVTDFAPCFISKEFRNLLVSLEITHSKDTPCRPESNGVSEVSVKLFRKTLSDVIMGYGYGARRHWDQHLTKAMLIFNHSPLYSKVNKISRIDNFFHPDKYKLGHLYNLTEDEEMQRLFDYNESLRNIYKAREDSRRSYIRERINPFRINQLVVVPLSKNNQRSEAGGTGLKSSVQSIFSVKDVSPTGCRTVSLYDGSEQTFDIQVMRPLKHSEVIHCFGRDLTDKGTFHKNIYKQQKRPTFFQLINDIHRENYEEHDDEENPELENSLRHLDIVDNSTNLDMDDVRGATWSDQIDEEADGRVADDPGVDEVGEHVAPNEAVLYPNNEPPEHESIQSEELDNIPTLTQSDSQENISTYPEASSPNLGATVRTTATPTSPTPTAPPPDSPERPSQKIIKVQIPREELIEKIEELAKPKLTVKHSEGEDKIVDIPRAAINPPSAGADSSSSPRSSSSGSNTSSRQSLKEKAVEDMDVSDWSETLQPVRTTRHSKRPRTDYKQMDGGDLRKKARNYNITFNKNLLTKKFAKDKEPIQISASTKQSYERIKDQSTFYVEPQLKLGSIEIHFLTLFSWGA